MYSQINSNTRVTYAERDFFFNELKYPEERCHKVLCTYGKFYNSL